MVVAKMRAAHVPMKILRRQVNCKDISQKMIQLSADRGTCLDLVATYTLTAAFCARWQAQTHYAKLPNGSLDPMYVRAMSTHGKCATLITLNGLVLVAVCEGATMADHKDHSATG